MIMNSPLTPIFHMWAGGAQGVGCDDGSDRPGGLNQPVAGQKKDGPAGPSFYNKCCA